MLTDEQKEVVISYANNKLHHLVVACPGSGKTLTLVSSIEYLIKNGVKPEKILAFTFTKAATEEMRGRLFKNLREPIAKRLDICTMHSLFFRYLRANAEEWWGWREVNVLNSNYGEDRQYMRKAMKIASVSETHVPLPKALSAIRFLKANGVSPDEAPTFLEESREHERHPDEIAKVYKKYEMLKDKDRKVDFDDMLFKTLDGFLAHPHTSQQFVDSYDYILADEFHDTSFIQNEFLMMAGEKARLFLVCDPNQSIYGFRGAKPEIVIDYPTYYPGAKVMHLTRNFRSGQRILDHAYDLIGNNENSRLLTKRAMSKKEGGKITYRNFNDEETEAATIAFEIKQRIETGVSKPKDFKILMRMNYQTRSIEEAFSAVDIPYRVVGSDGFYSRREIRDLLSYLSFLNNPDITGEDFKNIYNRPNRFLGRAWYDEFMMKSESLSLRAILESNWSKPYYTTGSRKLLANLLNISRHHKNYMSGMFDLAELSRKIMSELDYYKYLIDNVTGAEDRIENVQEFIRSLSKFNSIQSLFGYIDLMTKKLRQNEHRLDKVNVMTGHKSKGTEAKIVHIIGFNDGVIPHIKGDLLEERRLAFVMITRAEEEVHLSSTSKIRDGRAFPSSFLDEMKIEVNPELRKSQQIQDSIKTLKEWEAELAVKYDYLPEASQAAGDAEIF